MKASAEKARNKLRKEGSTPPAEHLDEREKEESTMTTRERQLQIWRQRSMNYYLRNRLKVCERDREYYQKNREHKLAYQREYYKKHHDELLQKYKDYYWANLEKRVAEKRARYYVTIDSKCENCGSTENLERHHKDYSKPLEVVTLCRKCHAGLHLWNYQRS